MRHLHPLKILLSSNCMMTNHQLRFSCKSVHLFCIILLTIELEKGNWQKYALSDYFIDLINNSFWSFLITPENLIKNALQSLRVILQTSLQTYNLPTPLMLVINIFTMHLVFPYFFLTFLWYYTMIWGEGGIRHVLLFIGLKITLGEGGGRAFLQILFWGSWVQKGWEPL